MSEMLIIGGNVELSNININGDVDTYASFDIGGSRGENAGFGEITSSATQLPTGSDPTVDVTATGPNTAKNFDFAFGIPKGDEGDDGNGIDHITKTSGSGEPGTIDTYTIFYTNGTTTTFNVYNGADGEGKVASVNGKIGEVVLTPSDIGLGSAFVIRGSVATPDLLPETGNHVGDVYYVESEQVGYVWINKQDVEQWEQLGLPIDISNYLAKDNTDVFNPTGDYNPATKKYVDDNTFLYVGEGVAASATIDADTLEHHPASYFAAQTDLQPYAKEKELGINIWDEEWELGNISSTGALNSATNDIRSKNYCPCLPNQNYYYTYPSSATFRMCWYDKNKEFIFRNNNTISPNNAYYFKITTANNTYGTTYNNDICINLSNPLYDGTYYASSGIRRDLSINDFSREEELGINVWDEQWELGGYGTSGQKDSRDDRIRSKNFIPVIPSKKYYLYCSQDTDFFVCFYDKDKTFIERINEGNNVEITNNANAYYITFFVYKSGHLITTYNNDICINLSNPLYNGKYFASSGIRHELGEITNIKYSNNKIDKDSLDFNASDLGVVSTTTELAITDLNNINTTSFIYCLSTVSNLPVAYEGYALTIARSSTTKFQFYTRFSSSVYIVYMRKCNQGTWSEWKSITFA